jgi:hypothetical protein
VPRTRPVSPRTRGWNSKLTPNSAFRKVTKADAVVAFLTRSSVFVSSDLYESAEEIAPALAPFSFAETCGPVEHPSSINVVADDVLSTFDVDEDEEGRIISGDASACTADCAPDGNNSDDVLSRACPMPACSGAEYIQVAGRSSLSVASVISDGLRPDTKGFLRKRGDLPRS